MKFPGLQKHNGVTNKYRLSFDVIDDIVKN